MWDLGLSESQKSFPETRMQGIPLKFGKRMVVRSIITILSALLATEAAMSLTEELATKFGPLRWNGDEQTWQQFKFEFINYSRRHGGHVPQLLSDVCEQSEFVRLAELEEEPQRIAGLLMTDLALKTTDRAQRLLMNLDDQFNGKFGRRTKFKASR